jgi:hypothetical protein
LQSDKPGKFFLFLSKEGKEIVLSLNLSSLALSVHALTDTERAVVENILAGSCGGKSKEKETITTILNGFLQ